MDAGLYIAVRGFLSTAVTSPPALNNPSALPPSFRSPTLSRTVTSGFRAAAVAANPARPSRGARIRGRLPRLCQAGAGIPVGNPVATVLGRRGADFSIQGAVI